MEVYSLPVVQSRRSLLRSRELSTQAKRGVIKKTPGV
jgi:hypothetical protein